MFDKPRFRRDEAAAYLEQKFGVTVAVGTLAKWATIGGGPAFQRFGRVPLYERTALDEWATAKLGKPMTSTSEARA